MYDMLAATYPSCIRNSCSTMSPWRTCNPIFKTLSSLPPTASVTAWEAACNTLSPKRNKCRSSASMWTKYFHDCRNLSSTTWRSRGRSCTSCLSYLSYTHFTHVVLFNPWITYSMVTLSHSAHSNASPTNLSDWVLISRKTYIKNFKICFD